MRANALLVRSRFGWSYEVSGTPTDVVEGLLELGNQPSPEAVSSLAQTQLTRYAVDLSQVTVGIEPASLADTPGHGFVEGDTVTLDGDTERVVSFTVARDQSTGKTSYSVELRNRLLEEEQRVQQSLRKMVDGTMRGDSLVASPVKPEPTTLEAARSPGSVEIIFEREAAVTATESHQKASDRSGYITQVTIVNPDLLTSDVDINVNGTTVETITLTGFDPQITNGLALPVTKGDLVSVASTDTGSYLQVAVQVT